MTNIIKVNINDTIEQSKWEPATPEETADYNKRLPWRDQKIFCQICIISDTIAEATHKCEVCNFDICDNEANHILDHKRIDEEERK